MYIYKFQDIYKTLIWGGSKIAAFKEKTIPLTSVGESWEISAVKGEFSVVSNGAEAGLTIADLMQRYGEKLVGYHVARYFGDTFPLLVKFIDARDNLSIQVHPDDKLAAARHNTFGKTEMWYVVDAEPGAGLYSGFSREITPEEYVERVANNTLMDVLQFHPVSPGDVFYLPAGRVHAIGSGVFIAEIQQTSDITYRIYDYNRIDKDGKPRELHTELAVDAIDYKIYDDLTTSYQPEKNKAVKLVDCPYFTTSLLQIDVAVERPIAVNDSFMIYMCMRGSARITDNNGSWVDLRQGETCLVPATVESVKIEPDEYTVLLECFVRED